MTSVPGVGVVERLSFLYISPCQDGDEMVITEGNRQRKIEYKVKTHKNLSILRNKDSQKYQKL